MALFHVAWAPWGQSLARTGEWDGMGSRVTRVWAGNPALPLLAEGSLTPQCLRVLCKTESSPPSLDCEKASIHIAEYLAKDLEGGGDPSFVAGFLPVPSGGTTLGAELEENTAMEVTQTW